MINSLIPKIKLVSILLISLFAANATYAEIPYSISGPALLYNFKDSSGKTTQKMIHPGCFRELATDLEGDNLIAAVNLSRAEMRSCMDSNRYYKEPYLKEGWVKADHEKDQTIGYQHLKDLGKGVHIIKYYEDVDGSMGTTSSLLLVRFVQKENIDVNKENKTTVTAVDTIERLGQIDKETKLDSIKLQALIK